MYPVKTQSHTPGDIENNPILRCTILDRLQESEALAASRGTSYRILRMRTERGRRNVLRTTRESLLGLVLAASNLSTVVSVTSRTTEHGVDSSRN